MSQPSVYIETMILSYLTSLPSRDLVRAAHQQPTLEWWAQRDRFELLVSEAVLAEIARGDSQAAARRIAAAQGLAVLKATEEARNLAFALIQENRDAAKSCDRRFKPPVICTPEELTTYEDPS